MHVNDVALDTRGFLPLCAVVAPSVEGCMKSNFALVLSFLHLTEVYHLDKYEAMTLFFYFSPLER